MSLPPGINAADFTGFPLDDLGRDVTRTPRTKTLDNVSGRQTWVDGTPATISAIVIRSNRKWMFDEAAKIEGGDAYIMVAPAITLTEGDLITADSLKYEIKNVLSIDVAGTAMFTYGNLFIYSDG